MNDENLFTPEEIEARRAYHDKLRSIGFMPHGRPSRPKIKEDRRDDGIRVKATTDELGNTVTEHATKDDRVDVKICPDTIHMQISAN